MVMARIMASSKMWWRIRLCTRCNQYFYYTPLEYDEQFDKCPICMDSKEVKKLKELLEYDDNDEKDHYKILRDINMNEDFIRRLF